MGCLFHKWKYLDDEHRICKKCGDCYYIQGLEDGGEVWQNIAGRDDDPNYHPLEDLLKHKALCDAKKARKEAAKKEREKAKAYAKNC